MSATGGTVREELPFTSALYIDSCANFSAGGMNLLGGAVELALQKLEQRKAEYKRAGVPYYQPWLVIISAGAPTVTVKVSVAFEFFYAAFFIASASFFCSGFKVTSVILFQFRVWPLQRSGLAVRAA